LGDLRGPETARGLGASLTLPAPIGLPLAALAFVLPGVVLVRREEWSRAEPIELAAMACAGSVAWWAAGIWFLGWLHISLSLFAIGSLAAAALILALGRRSAIAGAFRAWQASPGAALWSFVFIVAIAALRAIFAFTRLSVSVGDMSAHAYMTELIVMRNGLPQTYQPFLPIGDFGSFPPGFHVLAAVETLLGGVPTYRSTLHVLCFAAVTITFTLAVLLRGLGVGRGGAALGAAGALLLARDPQWFETWGGAPTLLAAALIFLVLRDALRIGEHCSFGFLARLGLFSAGALLTHQLPVVSFLYVFPVAIALRVGRDRGAWVRVLLNGAVIGAVGGVLSIPFLRRMPRSVPPEAAAWARDWFRHELEFTLRLQALALRWLGAHAGQPGPQTWPFYLITYLGGPALALLAVGLAVRWFRERGAATTLAIALVAVQFVLFAGAVTQTLPFWAALYPSRTGIWLAPPLAVAIAGLGSLALKLAGRRMLYAGALLWLGVFAAEGVCPRPADRYFYGASVFGGLFWATTFDRINSPFSSDDLRAFAWIRQQTAPNAVFATNYFDGGNMITAVAHRVVIHPHFNLEMFYQRELAEWRQQTPVDYIYVSSAPDPDIFSPRNYTAQALDHDPEVELVFQAGAAGVWKVKRPKPEEQLHLSP
jgi:hypothetical protein